MPEVNILASDEKTRIVVDIVTDEGHTITATPSRFALENSAIVSDHIVLQPILITLEFLISNIGIFAGLSSIIDAIGNLSTRDFGDDARTKFELMTRALDKRDLYSVVTDHRRYTNMALTDILCNNSSPFSGQLVGVLKFQSVNTTETEGTFLEDIVNSGTVPAKDIDAALDARMNVLFGGA